MDTGIIRVIQMDENGLRAARIDCPNLAMPGPGKYILADRDGAPDSVLGWSLFPVGLQPTLEESAPPLFGPIPPTWGPNTCLKLHGPLGHGFRIPANTRKLALAAFGGTLSRLLPLIPPALESNTDITIFHTPAPLPGLPPSIEIRPLTALGSCLSWPDFLTLDIPLAALPILRERLGLGPHERLPCPAQALILTPMPCAGIGNCGACAVPTRKHGYKLACKDGPVFDLNAIEW